MAIGVYTGRFQPFCKHHRSVAQYIANQPDINEIVIVKGSSQWSDKNPDIFTPPSRHPFTAQECCEMIDLSLAGRIEKPHRIVKVADTKTMLSDPLWTEWTEKVILAVGTRDFILFVVDLRIEAAFRRFGIECRPFTVDYPGFHATFFRKKMAWEPKEKWINDVDPEVADYLESINGPARIRRLLEAENGHY